MKLNEYQELAGRTAKYPTAEYPFYCLAEEAGEVMGKITKYMRKHSVCGMAAVEHARVELDEAGETLKHDLAKELGDCLWEISQAAKELGFTLEEIGQMNIDKLQGRASRGTICGKGDER